MMKRENISRVDSLKKKLESPYFSKLREMFTWMAV
jgi:hypothetical protein